MGAGLCTDLQSAAMARDIIPPHLAEGITSALFEVFHDGLQTDRVINRILKERKKWGSRDRRMFAESVYECSRWWRRLWFAAGLRGDCYAAENVSIGSARKIWDLWLDIHSPAFLSTPRRPDPVELARWNNTPDRATREAVSDWFDQNGYAELGGEWDDRLATSNIPAGVYLRTNLLKTSPGELIRALAAEGIEAAPVRERAGLNDAALRLEKRKNVFITETFKKGWFEVQDIGSQEISIFMDAKPGMRVIDACAGGGGKSLHLASIMQNKGKIIALDKNDWRLAPLRERCSRAGADIVEARVIESTKVIKRLYETADRLLLDVPCSGTGVLRRNPDAKWRFNEAQKMELLEVQQEILQKYSPMVKADGTLVYSTCSLFPSENQKQIEIFLNSESGKNWYLDDHAQVIPARLNTVSGSPSSDDKTNAANVAAPRIIALDSDGFYMARLKRK